MEPRLRFNLDELLKQNKLKASDLSKLTGIPKQTLSEWRSGLVPKSILSLKKVATTFGISLDELVFRAALENEQDRDGAEGGTAPSMALGSRGLDTLSSCPLTQKEAVVGLNRQGVPLFVAPAFQERLAWSRELLAQRTIFEFIRQSDHASVHAGLEEALEVGQPKWVSCHLLSQDLHILPQRCLFVPLSSGEGVLSIFYEPQSIDAAALPTRDSLMPVDLEAIFRLVGANFELSRPSLRLQSADLRPSKKFRSRPDTLAQLLFSTLQDVHASLDKSRSPASEVLELMAYGDAEALEIVIQGPSLDSFDRGASVREAKRSDRVSLAPWLAPALGAKVEWNKQGSLQRVSIRMMEATRL